MMIEEVLKISHREKNLHCLICFGRDVDRIEWLRQHRSILLTMQCKVSINKLIDSKDNVFDIWVSREFDSLKRLYGQRFDRVIGITNVDIDTRQFIQTRLRA